jgi:hypothetical protein
VLVLLGYPALTVGAQQLQGIFGLRPAVDLDALVLEQLVGGEEVLDLT